MRRFAFLFAVVLSGCGESGQSVEDSSAEGQVMTVGPISGANVEVHAVGDNGAPQRLLGSTTTGADGSFSLSLPTYTGWTLVKAWGGTFVDAATGSNSTIPEATPLWGVALAGSSPQPGVVTRETTTLTMDAQEMARDPGMTFADAVASAALKVQAITGVPNAHLTVPADLTRGPVSAGPEATYGALLAGYSEYAFNLSVTGPELAYAMAKDAKDGKFDGLEYFDPIPLNLSVNLAPGALTFLGVFSQAWLQLNPRNASGLDAADLPGLSALSAANNMMPSTPRIQGVWNGYSPLGGGNEVTVRGWGFGPAPEVFVGTTQVTPTSSSDTEIVFDTPSLSLAADYDLRIRTFGGFSYTSARALRYYDEAADPTVTGVEPAEGPIAGGTLVRITGTKFDMATRVFFGADEALVSGGTFPREIVAITPKVADAGLRDLRIEYGDLRTLTLASRYEYKKKDVGRTFDQSYLDGGFTAIFQKWDYSGLDFRATLGASAWQLDGAGQGTFTRSETTMLESGTTESTASGSAFATAEGQNGQVLTVDSGTNATNLHAFTIHPGGQLGAGLTAGGTVSVFKHGTGLSASTLNGKYGVSASFVHVTPSLTFGTGAGTMEFDGEGAGGLNLKVYERDGLGAAFRQYTLTLPFDYDVESDGALDVQLDPGAALSWDLRGRVTGDGAFASVYYVGTGAWQGRSAALKVLKLDAGVAPEDYRGEYDGGYMTEKTFDDDGDIYPKVTAFLSNRVLEVTGLESRHFAANDGGSIGPGPTDRIYQTGRVSDRIAGQYGRIEHADGAVGGFLAPKLGLSISVGNLAETVAGASLTDRLEYGFGVRFDSHYSKYSISGTHNFVSLESRWLNPGVVPTTGDESNQTLIGSVTFNPSKAVTIGGKAFSGFGGFDDYVASGKFVNRIGLSTATTFGVAPDLQADFAYGFTGDRLHYALAERDVAGPLTDFRPGLTLGKGASSPTGALLAYGSTPKYDRTSFTALAPQRTWSIAPSYRFGSLLADFDPSTGATHMRVERGTLSGGGSPIQDFRQQLVVEGGSPSTSGGLRTGSVLAHLDGKADFLLGGQIFGGFAVGNADMFLTVDFTDNRQTGFQVFVKDAMSAPPLLDYGMTSLQKLFSGTTVPSPTSVLQRSGTYTPVNNLLSLIALDQIRSNDAADTALGRQFNSGTASTTATGGFNFNFGTTGYSGAMTEDGCFGFGLPGSEGAAPTAMSLGIFLRF